MPTSKSESKAAVEEKEVEVEEVVAPKARFFTVAIDLILKTDNQDVSGDAVENACKEQIIVPVTINSNGVNLNLLGCVSNGTSESDTETQIDDGYGRHVPPEE